MVEFSKVNYQHKARLPSCTARRSADPFIGAPGGSGTGQTAGAVRSGDADLRGGGANG